MQWGKGVTYTLLMRRCIASSISSGLLVARNTRPWKRSIEVSKVFNMVPRWLKTASHSSKKRTASLSSASWKSSATALPSVEESFCMSTRRTFLPRELTAAFTIIWRKNTI